MHVMHQIVFVIKFNFIIIIHMLTLLNHRALSKKGQRSISQVGGDREKQFMLWARSQTLVLGLIGQACGAGFSWQNLTIKFIPRIGTH